MFYQYNSLTSTSDEAHKLLDGSTQLPFGIWSKEQTIGRGRLGKTWESPVGNLYLTIVLEAGIYATNPQLAPLNAASLLCSWLSQLVGIKPTIKWPNDILLNGQKIAGILVESSIRGNNQGPFIIGIGVNVFYSPKQADYSATCLQNIDTNKDWNIELLARSLNHFFIEHWNQKDALALKKNYESFSLTPGYLWRKVDTSEVFCEKEVLASGELSLIAIDDGSEKIINSAEHGMECMYLAHSPKTPIVVLDVGNHAIKLAYYSGHRQHQCDYFISIPLQNFLANPQDYSNELKPISIKIQQFSPKSRLWPVYTASVHPSKNETLIQALQIYGLKPYILRKRSILLSKTVYEMEQLGIDRLCAIEGFLASCTNSKRQTSEKNLAMVISAGTAMTIDLIYTSGEHLGGIILPGVQTGLLSLGEHTDQLPRNFFAELHTTNSGFLGTNTQEAMLKGVEAMSIGAIAHVAAYAQTIANAKIQSIITGGNGKYLGEKLNIPYEPHLTCQGIRHLALGGFFKDNSYCYPPRHL